MGVIGVPAVVQWDQQHLWSAGMQVRSPAQHSGLRTIGNCGSNPILGLGTPYATEQPKKKKKKKKLLLLSIPLVAQQVKDPTQSPRGFGFDPGLTHWVKNLCCHKLQA